MKKPKCKVCNNEYKKFNSTQKVCGPKCAIELVEQQKSKEYDKKTRELKASIKTKAMWLKEAQAAFNSYIRARDKGSPCISCDKPDNGQHQRHASHYRSVGACSSLRFNTFNVWASCATCNGVKSGNLIEYRIRLVKLIGSNRVEWLESNNEITRYDIDYLKRLKRIFNKRAKLIINRYNIG